MITPGARRRSSQMTSPTVARRDTGRHTVPAADTLLSCLGELYRIQDSGAVGSGVYVQQVPVVMLVTR
jgi:hypothetical protein